MNRCHPTDSERQIERQAIASILKTLRYRVEQFTQLKLFALVVSFHSLTPTLFVILFFMAFPGRYQANSPSTTSLLHPSFGRNSASSNSTSSEYSNEIQASLARGPKTIQTMASKSSLVGGRLGLVYSALTSFLIE